MQENKVSLYIPIWAWDQARPLDSAGGCRPGLGVVVALAAARIQRLAAGALLLRLQLVAAHHALNATLGVDDALLTRSGATLDDLEGLVNLPLASRTVQAVVLFKTAAGEPVRVSLRSKGGVDVRAVASAFGGGGHRNAAGCTLESSTPDARDAIVTRVVAAVNEAPAAAATAVVASEGHGRAGT